MMSIQLSGYCLTNKQQTTYRKVNSLKSLARVQLLAERTISTRGGAAVINVHLTQLSYKARWTDAGEVVDAISTVAL